MHQPGGHRIHGVEKEDRNLGGRGLGGAHRLVLEGHDQVDAIPDERLGRLMGRGLIGQVAPVQVEVLALFVP